MGLDYYSAGEKTSVLVVYNTSISKCLTTKQKFVNIESSVDWFLGGSSSTQMALHPTTMYVGGTLVQSTDQTLKFNKYHW